MDPWLMLVVGLIIGFLIYLLVDYLFWREQRICVEEGGEGVEKLRADYEARLGTVQADLNARDAELGDYRTRIARYDEYETALGKKGWTLGGFMAGLFGSRLWADTQDSDVDIDRFYAQLDAKDAEIADLRAQLATYNDADAQFRARGGSLAGFLGGWFGSNAWNRVSEDDSEFDLEGLFARIDGLEADVDAKNARIAELEAQIGDVDIEDMQTRLAVYDDADAKFRARGGSLAGFLGGWFGSKAWDGWNSDEEDDVDRFLARVDGYAADIDGDVTVDSDVHAELEDLRARVAAYDDAEAQFSARGGSLAGFLGGWFGSSAWNRVSEDDSEFDLEGLFARIDGLEADVDAKNARIAELEAELAGGSVDVDVDAAELADMRARLATYDEADAQFRSRGGSLTGFLGGWFGSSAWNRVSEDDSEFDLEGLFARIDGLEADVDAKNARIAELEAELAGGSVDVDVDAAELADMRARLATYDEADAQFRSRGGSLTGFLGGWFGSSAWNRVSEDDSEFDLEGLFVRIDSLETDLDARDRRIAELELQLANIDTSADASVDVDAAELADMRARLATYDDADAQFRSRGGSLTGFLGGWFGSNAWNRYNNDDSEFDLEGLFVRIDSLESDIDSKDAEIADLKLQLANTGGRVSVDVDSDSEVADLRARLATYEDAEAQFSSRGGSLTGFLGGWFGSNAWNRYSEDGSEFDLEGLFGRIDGLEADVEAKDVEIADLRAQLAAGTAATAGTLSFVATDSSAGAVVDRDDDYTIVWGIGPKINGLLKDAGLRTYEDLATADPEYISATLEAAGPRFRLSSDELQSSWQEQAQLAADGRWDELNQIKAELAAARKNNDSLRHIWGVGSKAEGMLGELGINGLADLRSANRERLGGFLSYLKSFYGEADEDAVYASIQEQANLASDGRWISLRRTQEPLRAARSADDLTEVWGIGRKASGILSTAGITSFSQLAESDRDSLSDSLVYIKSWYGAEATEDEVYTSVTEQARFAAIGDWDAVNGLQSRYRALRRSDDLKLLWGIGPKVEEALNAGGIRSFLQLAEASVERIDEILESSGSRFSLSVHDLQESWKEQAQLAAEDRWEDLDEMQADMKWGDFDDDPDN